MANQNIDKRRNYVVRLMDKNMSAAEIKRKASIKYGCSAPTINSDINFITNSKSLPQGCHSATGIKLFIFYRDNFICQYCLKQKENLVVEHVIPIFHGGLTTKENLVTACAGCNTGKKRQVWIPNNFISITENNIDYRNKVLATAVKDFR